MATEPYLYEADQRKFLDRARRTRRLVDETTSPTGVDVATWSAEMKAILREVPPLPLVNGVRYRIRLFGGQFDVKHFHGTSEETGETVGFELPVITGAEMTEVEGVFRGRRTEGPWRNLIHLDLAGKDAFIADTDVLRCEEIR